MALIAGYRHLVTDSRQNDEVDVGQVTRQWQESRRADRQQLFFTAKVRTRHARHAGPLLCKRLGIWPNTSSVCPVLCEIISCGPTKELKCSTLVQPRISVSQQIYETLKQRWPKLVHRLYQHNQGQSVISPGIISS